MCEVTRGSIKVIIADDHPVVLHGLVSLLSAESDFEVLATCTDGAAALEAIVNYSPDIALLDLRLPKMTGREVMDKVPKENKRVVIITAFAEDHDVLAAVKRGAHGIIVKDSATRTLISCLRQVGAGFRCVSHDLIREELHRLTETNFIQQLLTSREREVLCLVARGLSNKNVANQLKISEGTVKLHLHHIYCKLGVRSRSVLMTLALRAGGMRVTHKSGSDGFAFHRSSSV